MLFAGCFLGSLVNKQKYPINFVCHQLEYEQVCLALDCSTRSCGAWEKPSRTSRCRTSAAGNHPPGATKFAGDHTARDHPFPSRTRKLSLVGPMVLHGRLCGRLGDRRQYTPNEGPAEEAGLFAFRRIAARFLL